MLQQLRKEILIAEAKDSDIIAAARASAKEIAYKSEREIIERRATFMHTLNTEFNDNVNAANASAVATKENSKNLATSEVEAVKKAAAKNKAAAIKLVVDNILC